jgi:hypothetical protein
LRNEPQPATCSTLFPVHKRRSRYVHTYRRRRSNECQGDRDQS